MRRSIKKQIGFTFIGFIVLLLLAIGISNYFFLESFYLNKKVKIIKEGMVKLNTTDIDDIQGSEFAKLCQTNNLSVVVSNNAAMKIYTNLENQEAQMLASKLFGYLTGVETTAPDIMESGSNFRVQQSNDKRDNMDYMEIWGMLDDGRYFIIRTPLQSIRDSVDISNQFFIYIGLGFAGIAFLFIWHFSRKITEPIVELTRISQQMADLNFEARYESGGNDEIGILGQNINKMSETLEAVFSELKSANNELQKDIEKKTQIDEMRKEFLANVSHELKTPIALIQGYAEGLQDNINEDAGSRDFYCEVIIDEAVKMNVMVKKLLSLNQLEFGTEQLEFERFEITDLIRGVIQSSSILVEQKGAQVIFNQEQPLYVWGDEFKVEEVISNFFSNALNHIDYERKIEIRCQENDGTVRISVFNTGNPIPEEDLDQVWIKFYKVDKARTREYGGSGIGLSIVKVIVEAMNQQCGVRNYDNGVEFWFTLESKN